MDAASIHVSRRKTFLLVVVNSNKFDPLIKDLGTNLAKEIKKRKIEEKEGTSKNRVLGK